MKKIVPSNAVLIHHDAKLMYQGIIYGTYQWQQELFDGSEATFEMLRRPDTVEVIAIVDDKIVVLNDEQPHRGARLGFPGGRVDDTDESILAAAKRETLEETGYSFSNWRLVKVWQPQTKIEWFIHLFIAWGVADQTEPHLDGGEKITIEHLPFGEVKELVAKKAGYLGEIGEVFEDIENMAALRALPEFKGKEIEVWL